MEDTAVLDKIKELTAEAISASRAELVDLTYRRESGGMVLRFTVDKAGGISIGECGGLSRKIEAILDGANIIEERYVLEVQSPGLDRPFVKTSDFERAIGKDIVVYTCDPVADNMENSGKLKWVSEEKIIIETPIGAEIEIPRGLVTKAKLDIRF